MVDPGITGMAGITDTVDDPIQGWVLGAEYADGSLAPAAGVAPECTAEADNRHVLSRDGGSVDGWLVRENDAVPVQKPFRVSRYIGLSTDCGSSSP